MQHALIIGAESKARETLEDHLWHAGYHTLFAPEDMAEAWAITRSLHPDLIIVLPDVLSSRPTEELCNMSEETGAPIIVATADLDAALRSLGPSVSLDGPFALHAVAGREAGSAKVSQPTLHAV
ncbi:MAG: hypothetical protein EOP21_09250 [Hyphomicrobiales bacterium]|nr:MAG: hypothetical protein EOP21_09250 [Hyphomicrobiales bacterium]